MFLRPKQSLTLSLYSVRKYVGFLNRRDFHLTHCAYLRKVSSERRKATEVRDSENNANVAGEFSVRAPLKNVNDNFFGIESDEGVIEITSKPSLNNTSKQHLFNNVEQEKLISTTFGTIRYDSENKPKLHGQLEKEKVVISSNTDKDKICSLSQSLLKRNSVGNASVVSSTEESLKATNDKLDIHSKSKLPGSSFIDELCFPESYTEKENDTIFENSPSSSEAANLNCIENFYFGDQISSKSIVENFSENSKNIASSDENRPTLVQDKSTKYDANDKQSNVFDSYFFNTNADMIDDKNLEYNVKTGSIESTKHIANDKQSKVFDDDYFNTSSDSNVKIIDHENFEYNVKTVDTSDEQSNKENSMFQHGFGKNNVPEKLSGRESEDGITNFGVISRDARFEKNAVSNFQKSKADLKALDNIYKKMAKNDAGNKGEKLSLELNSPNLDELDYNKFIPNAKDLPKKKNSFLFQSKEFLKKSELTNSSRVRKLKSYQRNLDETEAAEKNENMQDEVKIKPETQNLKVQKEADVKKQNTDEQPETAYDFVKKLRSTKKQLDPELINGKFIQKTELYDSKGFRILKNQVPDLKYYTRDEILDLLVKNVLYSDDDLIVLNKPYNLIMHESKTAKDPSLSQYLDDLAAELDKKTYNPKLITVHRLDKETSGCLLLARNEISAQRLLSLFSQRKIVKTYWIVTIRVPDPLEGVIDMPISEGSVDGRTRMVLHPNLPNDIPYKNHSKRGKRAVTRYKVIAESGNAALVEANPETGIKHQIRVHFGFGLSCPILGDHKYSHLDKFAPQKLQSDLLQRLQVRQSKVRHIPMHLYARSILIPHYKDGRNLFVMAPMPIHISKNLQKLKFRKK